MSLFCPLAFAMEITQQVRDYAKQQELHAEQALDAGLTQKSDEFREAGGEIYS